MSAEYQALLEVVADNRSPAAKLLQESLSVAMDDMKQRHFDPIHVVVAILKEPETYRGFAHELYALGLELNAVRRATEFFYPQTNRLIAAQHFTPEAKMMCRQAVEIATKRSELFKVEFQVTPYDIGAAALLSGSIPLKSVLDGREWELPFEA